MPDDKSNVELPVESNSKIDNSKFLKNLYSPPAASIIKENICVSCAYGSYLFSKDGILIKKSDTKDHNEAIAIFLRTIDGEDVYQDDYSEFFYKNVNSLSENGLIVEAFDYAFDLNPKAMRGNLPDNGGGSMPGFSLGSKADSDPNLNEIAAQVQKNIENIKMDMSVLDKILSDNNYLPVDLEKKETLINRIQENPYESLDAIKGIGLKTLEGIAQEEYEECRQKSESNIRLAKLMQNIANSKINGDDFGAYKQAEAYFIAIGVPIAEVSRKASELVGQSVNSSSKLQAYNDLRLRQMQSENWGTLFRWAAQGIIGGAAWEGTKNALESEKTKEIASNVSAKVNEWAEHQSYMARKAMEQNMGVPDTPVKTSDPASE